MTTTTIEPNTDALLEQAKALKLHGLIAHFDELSTTQLTWLEQWLQWETQERHQRGLQRRLRAANLGRFKPLADFDWDWPRQCDQAAISNLMQPQFIKSALNTILVGSKWCG